MAATVASSQADADWGRTRIAIVLAASLAWLAVLAADATGAGALLHHHSLIEGGPPLPIAVMLFSGGWLVMVAAMMLPASLPAFDVFRPGAQFLGAYVGIWLSVGLACFIGDFVLHRIVDATPWLFERPWLVESGVVAFAGAFQLTATKRRALEACRQPGAESHGLDGGLRAGLHHVADCVVASGPLMLLMFAAGFANIVWMAALAVLMAYEAHGKHGHRAAMISGIALLYLATFALTNQGLPGWLGS